MGAVPGERQHALRRQPAGVLGAHRLQQRPVAGPAQRVRDAGGGDDEGGWSRCAGPEGHDPVEFLSWVAAIVRVDGWVSKAKARDDQRPTASIADGVLTPQHGCAVSKEWREARARYAPTEADAEKGKAALEYARALGARDDSTTGNARALSDYEQNLRLVGAQPLVAGKHTGILASALPSYERHLGRAVERTRREATSAHVGAVGDKVEWVLTVERVYDAETQYGAMHIHTMRDGDGHAIVWRTNAKRLEPGTTYNVRGTIKAHNEFRDEKQTELTRCKVVAPAVAESEAA